MRKYMVKLAEKNTPKPINTIEYLRKVFNAVASRLVINTNNKNDYYEFGKKLGELISIALETKDNEVIDIIKKGIKETL